TNLAPRDLADEAFLRRIRYKVKIDRPTEPEYREIFRRNCISHGLEYRQEVVGYLLSEHYAKRKIALNACHPRDIVEQLQDIARYQGGKAELTEAAVDQACMNYFVDM
ncbi:MAG TPA: hypothetical protein VGK71_01945, partial [Nitrospirota bacterium]